MFTDSIPVPGRPEGVLFKPVGPPGKKKMIPTGSAREPKPSITSMIRVNTGGALVYPAAQRQFLSQHPK
jgi:hypothetical protein